jgi:Mg2+-importing ATPase
MGKSLNFGVLSTSDMLKKLQTTTDGLKSSEVGERLKRYGANILKPKKRTDTLILLLAQFRSPITLILIFASVLSFFLGDVTYTVIILIIILISSMLGFFQEKGASDAFGKLLAAVQIKAAVLRDGEEKEIPVEEIVPGDIIIFNAGDIIPADCLILESKDLFVSEATLTGETYPVEKVTGVINAETPLSKRTNSLWMGTSVVSGSGKVLAVSTGKETEFGKISERLKLRPPETEFEKGISNTNLYTVSIPKQSYDAEKY